MGITGNQGKRTQAGKDGLRLARRFRDHEDMILRFTTDLAVGFTSHLRRLLAHPGRPGRLRHRPVLPVLRRLLQGSAARCMTWQ
jgi:hypothetical protein